MNKHSFEQRVFYADTDSYGIVWHGSYLRWMEMGRVYWTEMQGMKLEDLRNDNDIVIPVAAVNIKYKMSAKVNDLMVLETELSLTFLMGVMASAMMMIQIYGITILQKAALTLFNIIQTQR